jgi:hypothetical protein
VDLMADRGWRDVELIRSPCEAHVPGCGLECPQRAQGRQMAVHIG